MAQDAEFAFVDRLSAWALVVIIGSGRVRRAVLSFEAPGGRVSTFLWSTARLFGLVPPLLPLRRTYSDARENGASGILEALADTRAVCARYRQRVIEDPLVRAQARRWPLEFLALHFDRLVELDVRRECLRIDLVRWILRHDLAVAPGEVLLLFPHAPWFPALRDYAAKHGLRALAYRQPPDVRRLAARARQLGLLLSAVARRRLASRLAATRCRSDDGHAARSGVLALSYGYRTIDPDPAWRSEFFWLEGAERRDVDVLLHGYASDRPLNAATREQLRARGIRVVGSAPGVPEWKPSLRALRIAAMLWVEVLGAALAALLHARPLSAYVVWHLLSLAWDYAYWYDFFAANRVLVNVAPFTSNASVGQVLALDALGGASVAYQHSVSNVVAPSALLTAGGDVHFVFSRRFQEMWRDVSAPPGLFVATGYPYDEAIGSLRRDGEIPRIRARLERGGARFVLCFFDENSLDTWYSPFTHEDATRDYEYLLRWLAEDDTLGLVVKPKRAVDLRARIRPVVPLLERAIAGGRCLIIDSDTLVGRVYPAAAALAADVSVAKLMGSTAGLEARLAGRPSLLIDTEGFRDHTLYALGPGRVVFTDWPSLRAAVEAYRSAPDAHPELGDWSSAIDDLDPFRDGQATRRMREYVLSLYDALRDGLDRAEALRRAQEEFARRWPPPAHHPELAVASTAH